MTDRAVIDLWCEKDGVRDGPYLRITGSGDVLVRAEYDHGDLDGEWQSWDRSGRVVIRTDASYVAGRLDGEYVREAERNKESRRVFETQYVDGVQDGAELGHYEDGRDEHQGQVEDGMKVGEWKFWHPNGALQRVEHWRAGLLDGPYEVRDPKGGLLESGVYDMGRATGEHREWYAADQQKQVTRYVDGVRDGPFTEWHENGKIAVTGGYARGAKNGRWQTFNENGALLEDRTYVLGLFEGPQVLFRPDGSVIERGEMRASYRFGPWIYNHETGALAQSGRHDRGYRCGPWRCAEADGHLVPCRFRAPWGDQCSDTADGATCPPCPGADAVHAR